MLHLHNTLAATHLHEGLCEGLAHGLRRVDAAVSDGGQDVDEEAVSADEAVVSRQVLRRRTADLGRGRGGEMGLTPAFNDAHAPRLRGHAGA
jgi:hypothetical protein